MRSRSIGAAVALITLVAGCGGRDKPPPAATPTAAAATGPRLVVVGDSLAAGRFAGTQAEAFPQQVAADMKAGLEVLAAPGVTTAQLAGQTVPRGDDVVIEAGTNDFLYQTPRGQFADDYRALVAKVKAASPGAKLVCLTTWTPTGVPRGTIPASFYDATIRRACDGGAVADVSPFFDDRGPAGRPTFAGTGDDFHPNSDGHAAIARLIESNLR
ncbi:SGNH/GDSL hydrolase family protein [Solirubrobacter soli]|uniref:SGNH/GDSL hydrolase family protein n=1 Tax=Solirubrobacter soli TaxID=363832 RepID=UPI0004240241|nr:SGNH/GDSL hydrolase family protein [Solirubrobacter soli]